MRIYRYYTIAIIALGAGCVWLASISYDRQPGTIYFAWQHLTLFILLGLLLNRMTSRLLGPGRRYAMAFFAPIVLLGPAMTTLLGTAASLLQGAASILREACFDRRKTGDEGTSAPSRRKGDESIYQGKGRNGLFATHLLNAAQAAIAIMFSGQIFLALGAEVGEIHTAPDLVPAVLAGVCLLLIEILLSETTTAFDRGRPLLPAWRNGLARSLPVEGSVVGLGLLL
ncbi:MAG: hypothetical protein GTO55_00450, partial [Armatimonadetes bacterium]|nr:hypothetical protein [Armatimonadota bacterium]NIM23906.1 hypothetical protein [Armatimonadota bacterium]NIM66625.1 hypothetical protein [Armatimonadota bacterium]NIM76293.1 hypothetical protein [Armatimonadota bacterium]NIN05987.1 hypothetical protein [Armatimonadota bacterium]